MPIPEAVSLPTHTNVLIGQITPTVKAQNFESVQEVIVQFCQLLQMPFSENIATVCSSGKDIERVSPSNRFAWIRALQLGGPQTVENFLFLLASAIDWCSGVVNLGEKGQDNFELADLRQKRQDKSEILGQKSC